MYPFRSHAPLAQRRLHLHVASSQNILTSLKATTPNVVEAEQLLLNDPTLSIDELARALNKMGKGLHKSVLTTVRQEVRRRLNAAASGAEARVFGAPTGKKWERPIDAKPEVEFKTKVVRPTPPIPKLPPLPQPEPFNPPRLAVAPEAVVPTPEEKPAEGGSTDERKRWLDDWLLEHAEEASTVKAREALKAQFGMALQNNYISGRVAIAKSLAPPKPTVEAKSPGPGPVEEVKTTPAPTGSPEPTIGAAIQMLKRLGVKRVEITPNGHYRVELEGDL